MPLKADYSPQVGIATGVGCRNGVYSVCPGGLAPRERSVCPRPPQEVSAAGTFRLSPCVPSPSVPVSPKTSSMGHAARRECCAFALSAHDRFSIDSAFDLLVHCGIIFCTTGWARDRFTEALAR